jgi:hypothetical protein
MSEPEAGSFTAQHDERNRRAEQETKADIMIMERVRAAGPDSDEAALLREKLKSVARGELMKLHKANRLFARVKSLVYIKLPPPPDDWRDSAEGLIYVSVERSLNRFFATAVFGAEKKRWRPDGLPLVAYFVNKCLFTFKDLYRVEHRQRGSAEILYTDFPGDEDETARFLHSTAPEDPESRAVDTDLLRRMSPKMSKEDAQIVWEKSTGKNHKEIGQDLSISDQAVNCRLYRLRRRVER